MEMLFILFVVLVLFLVAVPAYLMIETRMEVKPATVFVYNNMWTGKAGCFLPGTDFLIPGIHRELEKEVSLRNEAQNPDNVGLFTADGIELEVDYIVRKMRVGYPGMPDPEKISDSSPEPVRKKVKEAAVKAVTAIEYSKRRDAILTRIVALLQAEVANRSVNDLFYNVDLKKGEAKVNKEVMKEIEDAVNEDLIKDQVTTEWGFWVEMDLEDYNLPEVIRRAREQYSSAKIAGQAIADKVEASKVNPNILVIADAIASLARGKKEGGKS